LVKELVVASHPHDDAKTGDAKATREPNLMTWFSLGPKPVWRRYVSAFRKNLNVWAVWWPGDTVDVGDFGIIDEGCFRRKGSLREFALLQKKDIGRRTIADGLELGALGKFQSSAQMEASADNVASAMAEIDLSSSHGIFFRATDLTKSYFLAPTNVEQRLSDAIFANSIVWQSEWLLVHEVISAGSFVALSTLSQRGSLQVRGTIEALENLSVGKADARGKLELSSQSDFKVLGKSGAIVMGLSRVDVPTLDAASPLVSGDEPTVEFSKISPKSVTWDEEPDDYL
jgi:hypothetical protein